MAVQGIPTLPSEMSSTDGLAGRRQACCLDISSPRGSPSTLPSPTLPKKTELRTSYSLVAKRHLRDGKPWRNNLMVMMQRTPPRYSLPLQIASRRAPHTGQARDEYLGDIKQTKQQTTAELDLYIKDLVRRCQFKQGEMESRKIDLLYHATLHFEVRKFVHNAKPSELSYDRIDRSGQGPWEDLPRISNA